MKEKLLFLMQLLSSLQEQLGKEKSNEKALEIQNEIEKIIGELEWQLKL